MKKILFLFVLVIASFSSKAQYATINYINTAGISDLYVISHANGPTSPVPCAIVNTVNFTGPITSSISLNTSTATFVYPGIAVTDFIEFSFHVVVGGMPVDNGPVISVCAPSLPSSIPYVFSGTTGSYTIYFNSPAPGVLDVEIK